MFPEEYINHYDEINVLEEDIGDPIDSSSDEDSNASEDDPIDSSSDKDSDATEVPPPPEDEIPPKEKSD